jgi:hypothetical protein
LTYISYAVWGSCGGVDELEEPFCVGFGVATMDASGGGSKRLEDAEEMTGTGGVEEFEDTEEEDEDEEEAEEDTENEEDEEDEEDAADEDGGDEAEETEAEAEVGVGNEVVGLLKLVFC